MIIECINCNKKFEVNSDLIPSEGRTIQCGSCGHVWFFDKNKQLDLNTDLIEIKKKAITSTKKVHSIPKDEISKDKKKLTDNYNLEQSIQRKKSNFTLGKLLSYIIVLIISSIAVIILLDTFKTPLYKFFPNLELILYNLFETIRDITLFVKDLA